MERKNSISTPLGILVLFSLVNLLTACNDWHRDSHRNTDGYTSVAVGNVAGLPADTAQNPAEDTDTPAMGSPSSTDEDAPDDTANAEEPAPMLIALRWQPTPGDIDGYIVHTGPSPETATAVITVTPDTLVEYDATTDLGLRTGDQSCFRIKAYNADGESGFSDAVCYTVNS